MRQTASGCIYRLGLALFDLENPEKCLLRGDSWIFGPEADYERHGDVDDVVFPCGYTMESDGDTINLYYGAVPIAQIAFLARASVRASSGLAGHQRQLRSTTARGGCVIRLLRMFQFMLGCRHGQRSAVFTIDKRTYQVCLKCGQEFDYSWTLMQSLGPNVDGKVPTNQERGTVRGSTETCEPFQ